MKTFHGFTLGISLLCSASQAISQTAQVAAQSPYVITTQDANSRVLQWTNVENGVSQVHSYTELASGLNHRVNGQWVESKEEIDILPNGTAVATNGQHQTYFPGDIYQGRIELVTPEGLQLFSQPLGLSYFDGTNTVLIAALTNSIGLVSGINQVIYPNAFSGFKVDLRYTYTRAGFEQDVILRQQPPTPESLGLNPDTARLQILTEFFSPPQPTIQTTQLPTQAGLSMTDQSLGFGTMQMVPGRAFLLGADATNATALVSKHWLSINGRQFLMEEVPVNAIVEGLASLPQTAMNSSKHSHMASRNLKLPSQRLAQAASKVMLLAKAELPAPGFVLDYQTLNSSLTNYTFRGDTTYYISGALNLYGTNFFEGGAVIKYTTNASINVSYPAAVQTLSSAYRPVIFTAKDDNSVGETLTNSTGVLTNYYANPAIYYASAYGYNGFLSLNNFRIACAATAISVSSFQVNVTLMDGQIVNCGTCLKSVGNGEVWSLKNVLFSKFGTGMNMALATVSANNATFDAIAYAPPGTGPSILLSQGGTANSVTVNLYNCVVANVTMFTAGSPGTVGGDHNGFYTNGFDGISAFGTAWIPSYINPFQSVGAGNYYLTNGCGFQNVGTPILDATLLGDIQSKTTYPPTVLTNDFTANTVLTRYTSHTPTLRDNGGSSGLPDLGYHYDPLDYCWGGLNVTNATLTLSNGVAVATYGQYGTYLRTGSTIVSTGTPLDRNQLTFYSSVQEEPKFWGATNKPACLFYASAATNYAQFQFTDISMLASSGGFITPASGFANYMLKDCQLTAVAAGYQDGGTYSQTIGWTNNIFYRCALTFHQYSNPYQASLFNNLFIGGSLTINLSWQTWNWTVADNLFDAVTLSTGGDSSTNYNNAFYNMNAFAQQGGTNVTLTNIDFQAGSLGNLYYPTNGTNLVRLIDAGSRTAIAAGLSGYTTQTNQTPDTNNVDIGFHYRDFAIRPGFDQNILPANDDSSAGPVNLPFTLNFFGATYSSLYVNNNGNVTFQTYLINFTPIPLVSESISTNVDIIAPFWADVDTQGINSGVVTYGTNTVNGNSAFGVNWIDVGYYSSNVDRLNDFQLLLINRPDRASGDYDVEFNYAQIQWEAGDVSGGCDGLWTGYYCDRVYYGGFSARAGYASTGGSTFEISGSAVAGALLDTNLTMGLIHTNYNSSVLGRYVFQFHNGTNSLAHH